MQVVFLDQSGQLGGAEIMLLDLLPKLACESRVVLLQAGPFREALQARGIQVNVVSVGSGGGLKATKKAGLLDCLRNGPELWRTVRQVRKIVRTADVLYANTPKAWIVGAMVGLTTGVPLVCHLHDILSARHFSRLNRWLLTNAANRAASLVIANSEATKSAFAAAGGRATSTVVIPNGFDPNRFNDEGSSHVPSLRRDLAIGTAPTIAMVGRLAPWKGQHVFIEAISRLPGVHGLIVGEALFTEEDRAYADALRSLCGKLRCQGRIHFLGFQRDVPRLIRESDIVAHCSVEPEPFGRVIVEAMLCGRPVVVASEGGAAEIVTDGVTGLVHRPGDARDLAERVRWLLDHPCEAGRLATAARDSAILRFHLDHVATATEQVLRRVHARTITASNITPCQAKKSTPVIGS
jgi:glycosyltransferase involved in cell wall biosynthesis